MMTTEERKEKLDETVAKVTKITNYYKDGNFTCFYHNLPKLTGLGNTINKLINGDTQQT